MHTGLSLGVLGNSREGMLDWHGIIPSSQADSDFLHCLD